MNYRLSFASVAVSLAMLTGCAMKSESDPAFENKIGEAIKTAENATTLKAYTVSRTPSMAVVKTPISLEQRLHESLKQKKVRYTKGAESVPLNAILESLNEQGVNIVSQISLDRYRYSGFSINDTDALTALEILTGTLGLDFNVEKMKNGDALVYITSLAAESKRLNIGPRDVKSSISTTSAAANQQQSQTSQNEYQLSTTSIGGQAKADISSTFNDDFWTNLKLELEERLVRPIPRADAQGVVDAGGMNSSMYDMVKLGSVVVNKSTGTVTVMAPRSIRRELMDYIEVIDAELNNSIILRGQIIVVNNTNEESQGIDWGGLRNTGEGVLAIGNDVLGNVSISAPGEFADVVGTSVVAPSLIGYQRADKVIRAFNGFLERDSRSSTLQMPVAQTASGTPVSITDVQNEFQIIVSTDQSTSEGGTTNTGAKNNILTFQYGTNLTMTPRVDAARGIIRTDVNLQLKIKQGTAVYSQLIAAGNSAELSPLELPIIKDLSIQGQAILKPGEVIVMGGQTVEVAEDNKGGITGLKDGAFSALFGSKKGKKQTVTYYFLLSAYTVPYGV
jgi:type II secretory pathway component GspD/PulD (secretin)